MATYDATLRDRLAQLANVLGQVIGREFPYDALTTYRHGRSVAMKVTRVTIRHGIDGKPWSVDVRNDLRFEDGYVGDFTMDGVGFYEEYWKQI